MTWKDTDTTTTNATATTTTKTKKWQQSSSSSRTTAKAKPSSRKQTNKYYAVAVGRHRNGILLRTWSECEEHVKGHPGAAFKSFPTLEGAQHYLAVAAAAAAATAAASATKPAAAAASFSSSSNEQLGCGGSGNNNCSSDILLQNTKKRTIPCNSSSSNAAEYRIPSLPPRAAVAGSRCGRDSNATKKQRHYSGSTEKAAAQQVAAAAATVSESTATVVAAQLPRVSSVGHNSSSNHISTYDVHIAFDGGSRGNPGIAGAGAVLTVRQHQQQDEESATKVIHIRDYVGMAATNNQAEYCGLLTALKIAVQETIILAKRSTSSSHSKQHRDPKEALAAASPSSSSGCCCSTLTIQGDSELIIKQLTGQYRCRSGKLLDSYNECKRLMAMFGDPTASVQHVYRDQNKMADGTCAQNTRKLPKQAIYMCSILLLQDEQ
jgi:ribonuclease HI